MAESRPGHFLFDQGRDLMEGIELINQALEEAPESPYLLRIKGLGLYRIQEYNKAFEFLTSAYVHEYLYDNETILLLQEVEVALKTQGAD